MNGYTGIHHLALATRNMDETIRFWRDLLGMRLIAAMGRPGYRQYFFEVGPNDAVAFFEWPDVQTLPGKDHGVPVSGPFAFDHVAIGVAHSDRLWDLKDRLEAAGIWTSEVIDHGFIHSLYTFDPNNIPIEFSVAIPEADPRRNPKLIDRLPTAAAREEPEPQPGKWPPVTRPTPDSEKKAYPGEGRELLDRTAT